MSNYLGHFWILVVFCSKLIGTGLYVLYCWSLIYSRILSRNSSQSWCISKFHILRITWTSQNFFPIISQCKMLENLFKSYHKNIPWKTRRTSDIGSSLIVFGLPLCWGASFKILPHILHFKLLLETISGSVMIWY